MILTAPAQAADEKLTVTITRTDSGKDTPRVRVGETLTYNIHVVNNTDQTFTAFPKASNLQGVLTNGTPNCRWANLGAHKDFPCTTAKHTVTEADAQNGTFTPTITYITTRDREGTQQIGDPITATGTAVKVLPATPPAPFDDPAMHPSERVDGEAITLAKANDIGFECVRIPALTSLNNGWILAAWDGRPNNCNDSPNPNSIVQRISKDGGKSWSEPKVIVPGSESAPIVGYSDPSYVVDRETGKVFLFSVQSYDQGFHGSTLGVTPGMRSVSHAQVATSEDNGLTWSAPRTITPDITTGLENSVKSRFAASGEGIQKHYAPYKGRLVQQYTFKTTANTMQAVSIYSDDHGATWHHGTPFGVGMDENKVVELSNGNLMVNSRASDSTLARKVAISTDGGVTYGEVRTDSALIDPRNNGSIHRAYPDAEKDSALAKVLLFTNAASTSGRQNGTVKLSCDDGATWSDGKVFEPGGMQYSTITALRDSSGKAIPGKYGLLFEGSGPTIRYMQVSMKWLNSLSVCAQGTAQDARRGINVLEYTVMNFGTETLSGAKLVGTEVPGVTWVAQEVAIPDLAAGQSTKLYLSAELGKAVNAGTLLLPAQIVKGDDAISTSAALDVQLQPGELPSSSTAGVEIDSTLPKQSESESPAKVLDNDTKTIWHTPYGQTMTFPMNVDFTVPYDKSLIKATFVPRSDGANGKIQAATLYYVKDGQEIALDSVSDGSADYNLAKLHTQGITDGTKVTLRLKVQNTLGDTANKWVSMAEARFVKGNGPEPTFDQRTQVTPKKPAFDTQTRVLTIPSVPGAQYYLNGEPVAAGDHTVAAGTPIAVSAKVLNAAFVLAPQATTEWNIANAPVITKEWQVTFDSKGGSAVVPVTVKDGGTLTAPAAPTKDDANFAGWFADEQFTQAFDFAQTAITADITLYAKWDAKAPETGGSEHNSGNTNGTDNPAGGTDNPTGETDNPTGETDNPTGDTDNPTGETDNPAGETHNPTGSTDNPTGSVTTPTIVTEPTLVKTGADLLWAIGAALALAGIGGVFAARARRA